MWQCKSSYILICLAILSTVTARNNETNYVKSVQDQAAASLLAKEPDAVRNSSCTLGSAGVRKNWYVSWVGNEWRNQLIREGSL